MLRVIAYDIEDDRKRARLAKTLEGFGCRVQYSVFEAILTPAQYEQMKQAVLKVIDPAKDAVRYYSFCQICRRQVEVTQTSEVTVKPQSIIV